MPRLWRGCFFTRLTAINRLRSHSLPREATLAMSQNVAAHSNFEGVLPSMIPAFSTQVV
jgi:hypothetical protein